jgi:hypothetical protein
MKVYVLAEYVKYEGYSKPIAVFSTRAAAEACIKAMKEKDGWGDWGRLDAYALELDALPDET